MNLLNVREVLGAVWQELLRYRLLAVALIILVSSAVLAVGFAIPKTYTATATLYADQSNIIEPLLAGQAEVTTIERINEAREILNTRRMLEDIARDSGLAGAGMAADERAVVTARVRENLNVRLINNNYFEMTYRSDDPDAAFNVLSSAVSLFVERTGQRKQEESRGAFEFIEAQVESYKRQLEQAESRLQTFNANNYHGSESDVRRRISELRGSIEDIEIAIEESQARERQVREQLAEEEPFKSITTNQGRSELDVRLASLHQKLDDLRLIYTDTHPDIVSLRDQISELEQQRGTQGSGAMTGVTSEVMENPVYEELRIRLTDIQSSLQAQRSRQTSLERLLQEEYQRLEQVAANQARRAELTRDYDVTKRVYEDMLERKESARLSMTLDVEGQGVTFKIQEPASYPLRWDGIQLAHYAAAGPVLSFGLVFGLLGALVFLDGRIRSASMLQDSLPEDVPVLAAIPHYESALKAHRKRRDLLLLSLVVVVFLAAYATLVASSVLGLDLEEWVAHLTGWLQ